MPRKTTRRAASGRAAKAPPAAVRRLPLASLRVFVAVADHASFTRAADALGVTPSAASMQITALEKYLGQRLFERAGRRVVLTPEGTELLPRVRHGLEELESALSESRQDRKSGPLKLTMVPSFLNQWLLPRLPEFYAAHPAIELQFDTSRKLINLGDRGVHAAIRFGLGNWAPLHVEKLLDEWLVPVCPPAMLQRLGRVSSSDDLKRYRLLHSTSEPWSAWLLGDTLEDHWPSAGITFDDSVAIVRAAEQGQGLALARWSLVANEVAQRRLVVASERIVRSQRGYYFVCPESYLSLDKLQALRTWLIAQARSFEAPRCAPVT